MMNDIEKALEAKLKMRQNILSYVNSQIEEFNKETGLPVTNICIEFIDKSTIGGRKTYLLSDVHISVEL